MRAILLAIVLLVAPTQLHAQSVDGSAGPPAADAVAVETTSSNTWYWVAGLVGVGVVADVLSGGALSGPLFAAVEGLAVRAVGTGGSAAAAEGAVSRLPSLLGMVARDSPKYTGPAGWAIKVVPLSGLSGAGQMIVP